MSSIPDDSQIALALYQQRAGLTDQNVQPGIEGLHLPMLGLFGEVWGLLSELKKKQRDKDSYIGYQDSVIEEFGDTLWYFTNICARAGLPGPVAWRLKHIPAADNFRDDLPQSWGSVEWSGGRQNTGGTRA